MKEFESFSEIGILNCGDRTCYTMDDVSAIERKVMSRYPTAAPCDSIWKTDMIAWTLGLGTDCQDFANELSRIYPDMYFVVREVDNFMIRYDYWHGGKYAENITRLPGVRNDFANMTWLIPDMIF